LADAGNRHINSFAAQRDFGGFQNEAGTARVAPSSFVTGARDMLELLRCLRATDLFGNGDRAPTDLFLLLLDLLGFKIG
jgi:hypothetical protein